MRPREMLNWSISRAISISSFVFFFLNGPGKTETIRCGPYFVKTECPFNKKGNKLLNQGHIEKLEDCLDKFFVPPTVITVKRNGQ